MDCLIILLFDRSIILLVIESVSLAVFWLTSRSTQMSSNSMQTSSFPSAILDLLHDDVVVDISEIDAAGGIEAIVAVIKHPSHLDDQYVQTQATCVLSELAGDALEIAFRIGEVGGIEALIQSMERHKDVGDLMYYACYALYQIAEHEIHGKAIVESGGIEMLVNTIQGHADDHELKMMASAVLKALSFNDQNRSKIDAVGGIEQVIQAMNIYTMKSQKLYSVTRTFLQTLTHFAYHEDMIVKVVDAGGIEAVIQAMKQHSDELDIHVLGCNALCSISNDCDYASQIYSADGTAFLVSAMRSFTDDAAVQRVMRSSTR